MAFPYLDPPFVGVSWLDYPTLPTGIGFQTGHPENGGSW